MSDAQDTPFEEGPQGDGARRVTPSEAAAALNRK